MKRIHFSISETARASRHGYAVIRVLFIFCLGLVAVSAHAQTVLVWTGADDGNWGNPNNWRPYGVPVNGNYLEFDGNGSYNTMTNDIIGLTVDGLSFGAVDYELSGNSLTIDDKVDGVGGVAGAIDTGSLNASTTTTINCPLIFTRSAGIYAYPSSGSLTENTSDLYLNGPIQVNESCLLTLVSPASSSHAGGSSHLVVSGVISGAGSVLASTDDQDSHLGSIEFSASSSNTFSGPLYLSTPGSSSITFDAGGTVVSTTLAVTNGETANLDLKTSGQIGNETTILIANGSTLSLSGSSPTVGAVVLTNASADALPSVLDSGSTTVGLNGGIVSDTENSAVHPTIKGRINFNGLLPVEVDGSESPGLEIQATIEGAGFNKTGRNLLTLSGYNSFAGNLEISEGPVAATNAYELSPSSAGVVLNGGELQITGVSTVSEPLICNSSNSLLIAYGTCTWAGPVTLNQTLSVLPVDNTRSGLLTTFYGAISGPGGMTLEDAVLTTGNVLISGAPTNTFTGPLTVQCQLLELSKPSGTPTFGGPLIVGTGPGTSCEARWFESNLTADGVLTVYTNGLVNLNNFNDSLSAVTFNGGKIETGSGKLSLNGPVTVNASGAMATMSGNITLPGENSVVFDIAQGDTPGGLNLLCNAAINGSATLLVKQGGGNISLAGQNTSSAGTYIEQGIIYEDNASSLGTTPVTVWGGATLQLDVATTLNQNFEIYGDGFGGSQGALDISSNIAVTINGNVLLDHETTLNVESGGSLLLNGIISGTGPLTETGGGATMFGGSSANTYTGTTYVNQGNLVISKPDTIVGVPGNLVIGTKSAPVGNSGTTATVQSQTGNIGGTNVTVDGGSLYSLVNGSHQFLSGVNLINGGSISTGGAGTLELTAGSDANVVVVTPGQTGASVISGNLYLTSGGNFSVGARTVTASDPELDLQASLNDQVADGISKSGLGRMQLSAANSFSSAVTINDGTLILTNSASLGDSSSTTVNGNGTLKLENFITIGDNALTLNSSNAVAFASVAGPNAWTGDITLEQTCAISIQPVSGVLDFLGPISGPGGLTTVGSGTLQFVGTNANTYAGVTTVAFGVLEAGRSRIAVGHNLHGQLVTNEVAVTSIPGDVVIGSDAGSGTSATLQSVREKQFTTSANISVHLSGLLELEDVAGQTDVPSEYAQTLTGAGQVILDGSSSFTIDNSTPFNFEGVISGSGNFTKEGPGSMTTWGQINNTGLAQVLGGDWYLFGERHNGGINVFGLNGDSARLRGDGTVDGNVTVGNLDETGGSTAVDSHYPDHQGSTLFVGSLSNASPGCSVQLNLFGPSPTGGNDRIVTTSGGVSLYSDTVLSTSFSYPPREGDVIDLIGVPGGQSITGTFSNFPEGIETVVGQTPVVPSYHGGAGNDFTLTVTNLALSYSGYQLAEGNGNQTVEPDECNLLYVSLVNRQATAVTITNAYLRATNNTGVVVTVPVATFSIIPPGETVANSTPFQFKTDTNLPCGGAVGFELILSSSNAGQFAVDFSPASGSDCSHPTGSCESCATAFGEFTSNAPTTSQPLYLVGSPSICYPPKAFPGTNPSPLLALTPYLTHSFTNSTTNSQCITAELDFTCPLAVTNALGVAAYLGDYDPNNPSGGYLGDIGQGGPPYPAFSFQVPANTNFTLVVIQQATNLVCEEYTLRLFGLPCPLPSLVVEPDTVTNKLRVDWSTAYPGWTAQRASKLNGTFTNTSEIPAIIGGRYALTNIATTTNQFYRLKN